MGNTGDYSMKRKLFSCILRDGEYVFRMSLGSRISFAFFALALLTLAPLRGMAADAAAPITLRLGQHDTFTRLVLECPALTPYAVTTDADGLHVVLTTPSAAKILPWRNELIKKITARPQDDGTLRIDIGLPRDAKYRDYRYENKIILDVAGPASEKPAAKPQAPPEKPKEAAKPAPAAAIAAKKETAATAKTETAAAAKTTTPAPDAAPKEAQKQEAALTAAVAALSATPAQTTPAPAATPASPAPATAPMPATTAATPAMPALPVAPVAPDATAAPQEADETLATLTLSSLTPLRLAVFERFGALWIVTDSAGRDAPAVSGKMAPFIDTPKTLRLSQGSAFRYTFPRRLYASVSRRNLSWQIDLHSTPQTPGREVALRLRFDKKTGKAMMLVPLRRAGDVIAFQEPDSGDTLQVAPTANAGEHVAERRTLSDIETLPAITGFVLRPLKDGVAASHIFLGDIALDTGGDDADAKDKDAEKDIVVVTAPQGLSVTPEGGAAIRLIGDADAASDDDNNRLFDFPNWRQGGTRDMRERREEMQADIAAAETPEERAGRMMALARLYFANNFGHEALGVLEFIRSENPEAEKNPDFLAVRGAARAMSGHYQEALQDLSFPALQGKPEASLWQGYAAAATEQWRMADRAFPQSNRLLLQYPDNIAIPLTLYMAESALHLGRTETARQLLDSVNRNSDALGPQHRAAIDYLSGVALAQKGDIDGAIALWTPVAGGLDRLYHAKAGLSLARALLDRKKITLKEAIDRVDSLRFAWRGDGLEVAILQALGELKIEDGQVLSGLDDMRRAADMSDALLDDSTPIRDEMRKIVSGLFTGAGSAKMKPLEIVSVYTGYSSLIPAGAEAEAAAQGYIDNLIRVDLLTEAEAAMEKKPADAATGAKLAAVYLLDGKPAQAVAALDKTESAAQDDKQKEERALLRARALSQGGKPDAAIAALGSRDTPEARQLKADIYWHAQKWPEAAAAIETLLPDPAQKIGDAEAQFVVNAAVAWRMAGDMDKLRALRARYAGAMRGSALAATFAVAARDGGASALADRETLLGTVGEVDMFKGFLDQYRAGLGKDAPAGGDNDQKPASPDGAAAGGNNQ